MKSRGGGGQYLLDALCDDIFAGGDYPKEKSDIRTKIFKYPIYSNGKNSDGLYGFSKTARVFTNCVTVSARGTIGWAKLRTEPFLPIVRLICAVPNIKLIFPKMLELLINYHADFENNGTTIRQLTVPQFKNYRLRVPSLDKQNTIISEVEYYESVITQNQSTIANLERQKGDVLNHNLLARIPKT